MANIVVQMIWEEKENIKLSDEAANYMESFFRTRVEFDHKTFNQARMKIAALAINWEGSTGIINTELKMII